MFFQTVKTRMMQGSSHAGIAAALQALQYFLPPPWGAVVNAGTVLFGAVAVALNS
jgi:hypothetical protein